MDDINGKAKTLLEKSGTWVDPVQTPSVLVETELMQGKDFIDILTQPAMAVQGQVSKKAHTAAVILAGGIGERFGNRSGKQLIELHGKPILTWSAEAFDAVPEVGLIVVVAPENRMEEYCRVAIDAFPFVTPVIMAPAGAFRQESSFSGISKVPESYEYIAIHDASRPLVTPGLISHTLSAILGNLDADGAVVGYPAIDTLKIVSDEGIIGTPDRSAFWVAQTPQVFRSDVLRRAHATALAEGFVGTDDSSLVERIDGNVLLVHGPRNNIKLTTPEDRLAIEAGLAMRLREQP